MSDAEWAKRVREAMSHLTPDARWQLLRALAASGAKIVPVEATPRMWAAADQRLIARHGIQAALSSAIAAAPEVGHE